ncbi:hypothetical protein F4810DRAFT_723262 [Camillea tinctor]|nr:hypothetical protein F4810DRAFT_723262 [Camillea tinctor]
MSYPQHYDAQAALANNPKMNNTPRNRGGVIVREAVNVHDNVFRGYIKSFHDALTVEEEYKETYDEEGTDNSDFPLNEGDQQGLVKDLFEAIINTNGVLEKETNFAYKKIATNKYSPLEIELMSWKVLDAIRVAQDGKNEIPPWYTEGGPKYQRFKSFTERFSKVRGILKESKDMVKNIFTNDMFAYRLAWNPRAEASRKQTNRTGNQRKGKLVKIGANRQAMRMQFLQQQGIHVPANEDPFQHQVDEDEFERFVADNEQASNDEEDENDDEHVDKRLKRTASQAAAPPQLPVVNNMRRYRAQRQAARRAQLSNPPPPIPQMAAPNNPQSGMAVHNQQWFPAQPIANNPQAGPQQPPADHQQPFATPVNQMTPAAPRQSIQDIPRPAVVMQHGLTFPVAQDNSNANVPAEPVLPVAQSPAAQPDDGIDLSILVSPVIPVGQMDVNYDAMDEFKLDADAGVGIVDAPEAPEDHPSDADAPHEPEFAMDLGVLPNMDPQNMDIQFGHQQPNAEYQFAGPQQQLDNHGYQAFDNNYMFNQEDISLYGGIHGNNEAQDPELAFIDPSLHGQQLAGEPEDQHNSQLNVDNNASVGDAMLGEFSVVFEDEGY